MIIFPRINRIEDDDIIERELENVDIAVKGKICHNLLY